MMGSPYYYEVHFDPIDVVFHDCMWSGTCCIQLVQQPPETVVQQQQQQEQQRHSAAEHLAHQISLASSSQAPHVKQLSPSQEFESTSGSSSHQPDKVAQHHNHSQPSKRLDNSSGSSSSSESSFGAELKCEPVKQTRQQAKQHAARQYQLHIHRKQAHHSKGASGDNSATNNKKLRHREVEKNRHRQLQAMVKTLSDRIPGKIDKETQVQTMKRAAKYCLYLREVLTHGPPVTKEKLERIYSKSCESVDLLMASD